VTRYGNGLDRQASHLYVPQQRLWLSYSKRKNVMTAAEAGGSWPVVGCNLPMIESMSCCPKLPHLALLLQHPRAQCEQYVLLRRHQNDWKLELVALLLIRGTTCTPLHLINSH